MEIKEREQLKRDLEDGLGKISSEHWMREENKLVEELHDKYGVTKRSLREMIKRYGFHYD